MSTSDRPTDPAPQRRSYRPSPAALYGGAKWLVTTAIATVSTILTVNRWVEQHVTETELEHRLEPVDAATKSMLESLVAEQESLRALAQQLEAQRRESELQRLELFENYWLDVGNKAAELETDRRKIQQSADRARDRFEAYYRQGMTMRDAYRKALRWGLP